MLPRLLRFRNAATAAAVLAFTYVPAFPPHLGPAKDIDHNFRAPTDL